MNPFAGFSEWALTLLPRLFLYPGGLGMLLALLLALLLRRIGRSTSKTTPLQDALRMLATANVLSLACAWAGLALLTLPFTSPVPQPVDRFALLSLVIASLLFDLAINREPGTGEVWPSVAIVLALMSSLPRQSGLLAAEDPGLLMETLMEGAVLAGLVGLFGSVQNSWSGMARMLAWWSVTVTLGVLSSDLWGLLTLPASLAVGLVVWRRGWSGYATALAYLLALVSLLTSLLLPQG